MHYVFIDSNVFLNFYTFNQDHLDKLDNLIDLIKSKKINLILPRQIIDEVSRNRENKLKETLKSLESFQIKLSIPSTCHDMHEMKAVQKTIELLKEQSKKLKDKLLDQIDKKSLSADKLIYSIFKINKKISISESLMKKAKLRFELGNPPGKNGSLGDAINWECILEHVPKKADLYFIGGDKDYISEINHNSFSGFLREEWETLKESKLFYYGLISQFLQENFPQAKITKEDIGEEKKAVNDSQILTSHHASSPGWHLGTATLWHTGTGSSWTVPAEGYSQFIISEQPKDNWILAPGDSSMIIHEKSEECQDKKNEQGGQKE